MNLLLLSLMFAGRKDDQIEDLQRQVTQLQEQLVECQSAVQECETRAAPPGPEQEEEAAALLVQLQEAMGAWEFEEAKALLTVLETDYAGTRSANRAARQKAELEVIGKDAPDLTVGNGVEYWFDQPGEYGGVTILVFFEEWCPHCQREMPKMSEWSQSMRDNGELQVIGVTKITKSSTDEKVREMLVSSNVTFPIAKDNGVLSEHVNVSGIPAAVVVKDGVVIWRGHPARLDETVLRTNAY